MKVTLPTLLALAATVLLASCRAQEAASDHLVVCGDDQVIIVEPARTAGGKSRTVWQWKVEEATGHLPDYYRRLMVPLDECKPVADGTKLLLTSSGGGVLLLDTASKECLFYADVPMAHSAELLPGRKIAVALSLHPRGNSIEVYDANRPTRRLFRDSLYSGHGVVWMPRDKRLYALGHGELRSYKVKPLPSDSVTLVRDKTWALPSANGHELSPAGRHELIVSTEGHVYVFHTRRGTFTPFAPLADTKDVKSANYDPRTGRLAYTKAETSWWPHRVYLHEKDKQTAIPVDSFRVYKVRPLH